MRKLWTIALIALSGCAHAPRPAVETDPIACARRIAHSLPVSGERAMTLNSIALYATPCDGPAPAGLWAHDPTQGTPGREALTRAYEASVRRDSTAVRREALRAFREPEVPGSQSDIRGSALLLLLDYGAFDVLLDRFAAEHELRLQGRDADRWRAEIAGRAARAGDSLATARAIRSCTTPAARERAEGLAKRARVLPQAKGSTWDAALELARTTTACRPECRLQLDFALARAADADRRPSLADSLVAALVAGVRAGERFGGCDDDRSSPLEWIDYFAQSDRLDIAEDMLTAANTGIEPLGWTKLAIFYRGRRDMASAMRAIARAHANNDRPEVEPWGAANSYGAMADTLLAAGWPEESEHALAKAKAAAHRVVDETERAMALADVAVYAGRGQADPLIREAIRLLVREESADKQARALARVGASARMTNVVLDEEEKGWLAEMAYARRVWTPTLSQ